MPTPKSLPGIRHIFEEISSGLSRLKLFAKFLTFSLTFLLYISSFYGSYIVSQLGEAVDGKFFFHQEKS